jgi:trehalose 6-phosphate phosphatase
MDRCDTGSVADALSDFLEVPSGQVLLACDFDGTIAPIVADPSQATPLPGFAEQLEAIVPRVRGLAVLSGRSENDLRRRLPLKGALLLGENGSGAATPGEMARLRKFDERARPALAGSPGVLIEVKPASISIHYRSRPEVAPELRRAVRGLISGSGLSMVANRMVFDIRPRRVSKVRAMGRLILELQPAAVLYAGDGRDDARVHRCLRTLGLQTLCVGVASDEMAASLFRHADLLVGGPKEFAALLGEIVTRWRGHRRPIDL